MTISDIAKMAGVSSAAVSRYLNGGPLSEQKRAVIQAVVEKTGYSPDTAAQTLRTGKVRQVGVIVPSISSQSVGQITSGIAAELGASRYLMLLADTELDGQMELEYLTALQRNHVAGIILLGYDSSPQLCKALKDCRVPVVVTGQRFADLPCVYILFIQCGSFNLSNLSFWFSGFFLKCFHHSRCKDCFATSAATLDHHISGSSILSCYQMSCRTCKCLTNLFFHSLDRNKIGKYPPKFFTQ